MEIIFLSISLAVVSLFIYFIYYIWQQVRLFDEREKRVALDSARAQEREHEYNEYIKRHEKRLKELKNAYEASGRTENIANPDEIDVFCSLTEKRIIQQCRRQKCHGCKMGWICPKFHS